MQSWNPDMKNCSNVNHEHTLYHAGSVCHTVSPLGYLNISLLTLTSGSNF